MMDKGIKFARLGGLSRIGLNPRNFTRDIYANGKGLCDNPNPLRNSNTSNFRKVACLSTSSKRFILPPLPQRIDGTTNDPAPIPDPSPTHGSYHWGFERMISAALIPLTIAPFAAGSLNPLMDSVLCGTIVIHSHIGFQSVIIDYLPNKRVPKLRALFWWGLNAGTLLVAAGLYEFETNDVGITEAIKRMWIA